jgi:uncharacterized membrane protein
MNVILFSFIALAYVFSGLICWLAFLNHFNQRFSLLGWQRLLAVLASFLIVVFWPIWIITETSDFSKVNNREESIQ